MIVETDVLIIGAGIAGMITALELAQKGIEVTLISSGENPACSNSYRAQGGISFKRERETSNLFKKDILMAGAGLCNEKAVDQLVRKGPSCVQEILIDLIHVPFNKTQGGQWKFTKEGAHSVSRILFHKDRTGKAIVEGVYKKVLTHPKIDIKFQCSAVDLITPSRHSKTITDIYKPPTCVGAYVLDHKLKKIITFFAKETILATGGVGECFLHTTNGKEAQGDGIAMAYRAGVRIMNMEYVQFHPTTLYMVGEPRFLLSEALRGEGGKILTYDYQSFIDPLSSRDIAARAIFEEMIKTNRSHLWLDISHLSKNYLKKRFPTIYGHCIEKGWDLGKDPIPIVPAAHYHCGGIVIDLKGRTTMRRLRAIGEVACSGVHGANRLASTALLECLVWAKTCSDSIQLKEQKKYEIESWKIKDKVIDSSWIRQSRMTIKKIMWNDVGLVRSNQRLKRAYKMLVELKWEIDSFYEEGILTPELLSLRNGCETALLITQGALCNPRSLGCHFKVETKKDFRYTF